MSRVNLFFPQTLSYFYFSFKIFRSCGYGARCEVINHSPICSCPPNLSGVGSDPFRRCVEESKTPIADENSNPCSPSPCGPNSICRISNNRPNCQCVESYIGQPPNCRPECTVSSECSNEKICTNNKCVNLCLNNSPCGYGADCRVVANTITCLCPDNTEGDPFRQCSPKVIQQDPLTPCSPSPCGFSARCFERNGAGSCVCLPDHVGNPYEGCRPECVTSADCAPNLSCIQNKCKDPCPGTCGRNAECRVISHIPSCNCLSGFEGDPFTSCHQIIYEPVTDRSQDPCANSICGPNARCKNINNQAICSCDEGFFGAPPNCRPECSSNSECPNHLACYRNKCRDPCPGTCGINAECIVVNHSPLCKCSQDYIGMSFLLPNPI